MVVILPDLCHLLPLQLRHLPLEKKSLLLNYKEDYYDQKGNQCLKATAELEEANQED